MKWCRQPSVNVDEQEVTGGFVFGWNFEEKKNVPRLEVGSKEGRRFL